MKCPLFIHLIIKFMWIKYASTIIYRMLNKKKTIYLINLLTNDLCPFFVCIAVETFDRNVFNQKDFIRRFIIFNKLNANFQKNRFFLYHITPCICNFSFQMVPLKLPDEVCRLYRYILDWFTESKSKKTNSVVKWNFF